MKLKKLAVSLIVAAAAGSAHATSLAFNHYWTFNHASVTGFSGGAEIVTYDPANDELWVVGGQGVHVLDPVSKTLTGALNLSNFGAPNSVDIANGKAAVSLTAPVTTDPGSVRFYDAATRTFLQSVNVGATPDMVAYTPDGSKLLVANEGEPNSYNQATSVDPEGSVSVIDTNSYAVQTAGFGAYNGQEAALRAQGVRIFGPNASVAQDIEPEYIGIDKTGSKAYVTLQENNAIGVVDIASATVTDLFPLGLKDHSLPGNGLDASDQDGINGNIQNWPVLGMYQPDAIGVYETGGQQYLVTANEGDARDYTGFSEEIRVGNPGFVLDPTVFPNADILKQNANLGRLNVTRANGDTDGDGDKDQIHVFGARSFSILDLNGNRVFDSGEQIEQIIKDSYPALWDDTRSDNKGPEPEGLVILEIDDIDLLFLGLERSNAVMAWDITDPSNAKFLTMLLNAGDVGPEGLSVFKNSLGYILAVANEVSRTTTLYRLSGVPEPATTLLFAAAIPGLLRAGRRRMTTA